MILVSFQDDDPAKVRRSIYIYCALLLATNKYQISVEALTGSLVTSKGISTEQISIVLAIVLMYLIIRLIAYWRFAPKMLVTNALRNDKELRDSATKIDRELRNLRKFLAGEQKLSEEKLGSNILFPDGFTGEAAENSIKRMLLKNEKDIMDKIKEFDRSLHELMDYVNSNLNLAKIEADRIAKSRTPDNYLDTLEGHLQEALAGFRDPIYRARDHYEVAQTNISETFSIWAAEYSKTTKDALKAIGEAASDMEEYIDRMKINDLVFTYFLPLVAVALSLIFAFSPYLSHISAQPELEVTNCTPDGGPCTHHGTPR